MTIPINAAEKIAKQYKYDQVIILARRVGDSGLETIVTYGIDKKHCAVASKVGNFLKHKIMGWPIA